MSKSTGRSFEEQPTILVHVLTVSDSVRWLRGQASYMRGYGFEVHAVASAGPFLDQFRRDEKGVAHPLHMTRAVSPLQDLVSLAKMTRLFARLRPSIVHAHTPKAGLLSMVAAWLVRSPVRIYHLHGLRYETARGFSRSVFCLAERLACRLATSVLSVSPSVMHQTILDGLCPAEKIKVLGYGSINGIDTGDVFHPERFSQTEVIEAKRGIGAGKDDLVLGFVGRVTPDKGILDILAAWRRLRMEFENLHLVILGEFEAGDPVPEGARSELQGDLRIHLLGFVDQPVLWYKVMDVLLLPTYREGLPTSVLEASAMARPAVANRVTGCIDAVVDQETGLLTEPGDIDDLCQKIRRYLQDPLLRRQHGQRGRLLVQARYNPQTVWELTRNEYRQLQEESAQRTLRPQQGRGHGEESQGPSDPDTT